MITNPNSPAEITPAVLASLDSGVASLRLGCASLPTADATLLRRVAKMGLKSESFSRDAIELAKQNRDLCPAGLDLEHAEQVIAVRDQLMIRYLQAQQLAEQLRVAIQVCGVDAFDVARTAYKSMKANCRDAALLELIDDLGRNFRGRRSKKDDALEPVATVSEPSSSEPQTAGNAEVPAETGAPAPQAKLRTAPAETRQSCARGIPSSAIQAHKASQPGSGDTSPTRAEVFHRIARRPQGRPVRTRIYWQSRAVIPAGSLAQLQKCPPRHAFPYQSS